MLIFAKYLLKKKLTLSKICPTLTHCISTAEVLTNHDKEILKLAFGVTILNEYGASEVGLLASESIDSEWLLCEEILFYEIIGKDGVVLDGNEGNIVVTDLDNLAMPFIRYDTGDIGIINKSSASDNKNKKLEKLIGRENDNILLPSGKISPGLSFYYVSRSILESSGLIKEFIIRQTELDAFTFEVVTETEINKHHFNLIEQKMKNYLEPGLKLNIKRVSHIERPSSGKIKHFFFRS